MRACVCLSTEIICDNYSDGCDERRLQAGLQATSIEMSDSETESDDLNISRYDPEDDLNVYGSPIYVEQQDRGVEDREGEQEQSVGTSATRVCDERSQVRIFSL